MGDGYTSIDINGRREARATLRRLEDDGRGRPHMSLEENRPNADYNPQLHVDRSPWILSAAGLPGELDDMEEKMRAAGLDFKRLERGP